MSVTDMEELAERIKREGLHTVEIGFADTVGVLRGKRIPARQFIQSAHAGIPFCTAVLAWDVQCEIFPGVAFASFDNGYPDLVARPDPSTFRTLPWREGTGIVLADLYSERGEILEFAPRQLLKRVMTKALQLGYRPKVGAELEFYLLDEKDNPAYDGIQCYSLPNGEALDPALKDIELMLEAAGIEIEASGTEYGPAQAEINLTYGDALAVADATLLFKNAVKQIARRHGLKATFMAKPWENESGSSFHVHQSLWSIDGTTNLFAEDEALAHRVLAGLLATASELAALGAPNVNSYKRFQAESFAPTNISWGHDNRTVSARALLDAGSSSRLEQRSGSADANPYLIIAANIAAGLHGIAGELSPSGHVDGNGYAAAEAVSLPSTLGAALDLLAASSVAREAFGDEFVDLYVAIGRHDMDAHHSVVTDWERRRYLERI